MFTIFDERRLQLLHQKYNELLKQEFEYIKQGNFKKADDTKKKSEEVAKKIKELTVKKMEKADKKMDKLQAKQDAHIEKMEKDMAKAEEALSKIFGDQPSDEEFDALVQAPTK